MSCSVLSQRTDEHVAFSWMHKPVLAEVAIEGALSSTPLSLIVSNPDFVGSIHSEELNRKNRVSSNEWTWSESCNRRPFLALVCREA